VLQIWRSLVRSQLVSLGFFIYIKSFRSHYGPGVDSSSNRNEYQEYYLGDKGGRCVRLTNLPTSCAVVMKSESPNFLEPSGPVQACNGTALPFFINSVHMPFVVKNFKWDKVFSKYFRFFCHEHSTNASYFLHLHIYTTTTTNGRRLGTFQMVTLYRESGSIGYRTVFNLPSLERVNQK